MAKEIKGTDLQLAQQLALLDRRGLLNDYLGQRNQKFFENTEARRTSKGKQTLGESLLPAGGAILAGLATAPLTGGLSLLPSLAIAGGAGAVGGGVGEALRQTTTGEKDDGFDFGDIAQEGAISGLFNAGGLGLGRAVQAGKSGLSLAQMAGASGDDLTRASQIAKQLKVAEKARFAKDSGKLASSAGRSTSKGLTGKINDAGVRRFFNLKQSTVKNMQPSGKNPLELGRNFLRETGVKNYDEAIGAFNQNGNGGVIKQMLAKHGKDLQKAVKGKTIDLSQWYDDMISKADDIAKLPGGELRAGKILELTDDFNRTFGLKVSGKDALKMKVQLDEQFGKAMMSVDDLGATVGDVQKSFGNALRKQLKLSKSVANSLSKQQDLILTREMIKDARGMLMAGVNAPLKSISGMNTINNIMRTPAISRTMATAGSGDGGGLLSKLTSLPSNLVGQVSPAMRGGIGTVASQLGGRALTGNTPFDQAGGEDRSIDELLQQDLADAGIGGDTGGQLPPPDQPTGGLSSQLSDPNFIQQLMFQDLVQTGGENISKLSAIFEMGQLAKQSGAGGAEGDIYENLTVGERSMVSDIDTSLNLVDQIEQQLAQIGQGKGGLGRLFEGAKDTLGAITQFNPEASAYRQQTGAYATRLIRALGEKGTLAQGDVQRALDLIPKLTDSQEVSASKLNQLRTLFNENKQAILNTARRGAGMGTQQSDSLANSLAGLGL